VQEHQDKATTVVLVAMAQPILRLEAVAAHLLLAEHIVALRRV
jgi:hypothetical protein